MHDTVYTVCQGMTHYCNYFQMLCSKETPEERAAALKSPNLPYPLRMAVILHGHEGFKKAFNCVDGDEMYGDDCPTLKETWAL